MGYKKIRVAAIVTAPDAPKGVAFLVVDGYLTKTDGLVVTREIVRDADGKPAQNEKRAAWRVTHEVSGFCVSPHVLKFKDAIQLANDLDGLVDWTQSAGMLTASPMPVEVREIITRYNLHDIGRGARVL